MRVSRRRKALTKRRLNRYRDEHMDILLSGDQSWAEEQQYCIASRSEAGERSEEINQLEDLREVYQTTARSACAFFALFLLLLCVSPSALPGCTLAVVQWLAVSSGYHSIEVISDVILFFYVSIEELRLIDQDSTKFVGVRTIGRPLFGETPNVQELCPEGCSIKNTKYGHPKCACNIPQFVGVVLYMKPNELPQD
jgi:hypothetical protein